MGRSLLNLGIIIQARMGSERLPGKVLRDIAGRVLLEHILDRLRDLQHTASIIVATTLKSEDDVIVEFCEKHNTEYFRGSSNDVLKRYYDCARILNFDPIIRLTADNPFTDIEELDRLIDFFIAGKFDYAHSLESLPVGVGAEIFSYKTLVTAHREEKKPHHREHVNEYMIEHPEEFKSGNLCVSDLKARPDVRLTVDTLDDWRKICHIAEHASLFNVSTTEAIDLCSHYA